MLVLDSTIGCIEASESEVLGLYRSAAVLITSSSNSKAESLEAYVCAIKKKTQVKVYLAFVADDRKIYVYAKPGKSEQGHQNTVQEALVCARSMGFSPEPVDLSYSPAMREVVVRNTKILRLPGSKPIASLKHGADGAPTLPIAKTTKSAQLQAPPVTAPSTTSPPPIPLTPSIPTVVHTPAPPLSPGLGDEAQEMKSALAEIQKELQAIAAERDAQSLQLRQLTAQHQTAGAELAGTKEACARLTAERDALAQHKKQLEESILQRDALEEKLRELGELRQKEVEELSRAVAECARLTAERDAVVQAAQSAEQASSELVSLQQQVYQLARQNEEANRHHLELSTENAALAETLARAREEIESVGTERDAMRLKISQHVAAESGQADAQIAAIRGELATEKEAAQGRLEVLEQQKTAAEGALAALRRELALLNHEHEMLQDKHLESPGLGTASLEVERSAEKSPLESTESLLTRELEVEPEATAPQMAERFDLPGFTEMAVPLETDDDTTGSAPQALDFTPFGDLQDDFFSASDDDAASVRFLLNSKLTAIEYNSPDEVVELHQSINNAYLSPDGKGQESCRGYVCCIKRDASMQVFAAIYGTQSGRTMVYLPEAQPEDATACAKTVRGALSFAEEVGLMMEQVPLDVSAPKRQKCLNGCPALRATKQK